MNRSGAEMRMKGSLTGEVKGLIFRVHWHTGRWLKSA